MLTASQDIDSFIERQRAKLNNQSSRQPVNRRPPPQPSNPSNNVQDRLDYKVARIFDEPPPRVQSQQPYYPSSSSSPPPQFANTSISEQQENFYPDQQQQRRLSDNNNNDNNPGTFFNKFGTYDDKRSQLKDDLKREYNEYLQSQKRTTKSKSTSQLATPRGAGGSNTNKRVQFQEQQPKQQQNGKVVAPWEKNENKTIKNVQSMNDLSLPSTDYSINRSRPQQSQNYDEQYVRDREEYILELHSQIRELESRKKQLEIASNKLSAGGSSSITRAHYTEDLNALNSLLEQRLDQRNAIDHELAHILNRPPVSASPTRIDSGGTSIHNLSNGHSNQGSSQRYQQQQQQQPQQQQNGRRTQPYRNDNRSGGNDTGFQIGHDLDKDSEQAAKKRYQQELQAQMREVQMRKAQEKQAKDEYERKLDAEIERYNYFGRSGGGAPMRDKDGNVVANLADVRNPPPPPAPPSYNQQQQYYAPDDKVYSLGNGTSSITNAPFYNGASEQQYPPNTDRVGSPNHTRGAVSNGIFGTAKTEAQVLREEKYKQELKQQIEEKRQRDAEETARRRAEEERELAKHFEWQQQMDRQAAEEAARKEKEAQERLHQQQLQEELERQRKQEEIAMKRKPKRQEKPMTPKRNDDNDDDNNQNINRQNDYDEQREQPQQAEQVYRSSSPPIPTLKNKGKKPKSKVNNNVRRESFDDVHQQQSPPSLSPFPNNDDFAQLPPVDESDSQGRQTYRKPPTPRQPDISSARKKPPPAQRPRPRANSNSGMPMRTNSTTSLRSDGSDSEVLNRLEHLKRQLKDKESRLQEHVNRHQTDSNNDEQSKTTYQPPSQVPLPRKQSPAFVLNAARVHHHRDSPITNDKVRRILQTDDDIDFKPSYFRDDTILMGGGKNNGQINDDYYSSSKRLDSANRMFITNTEKEANRRRYGHNVSNFYDHEDPTTMANYELNRIAEQNEQRLKKLRDLENDDASLLDSNEVLERFQQKQRVQRGGSQTTLQDDAWLK